MADLKADLKATEDPEKLLMAIKKIFPNSELEIGKDEILGNVKDDDFWELADKQKIRKTLETAIEENKGYVDLSKLAAAAGKLGIDEENPLGKIRLSLEQ